MNINKQQHPLFTSNFFVIPDRSSAPIVCKGYGNLLDTLSILIKQKTGKTKEQYLLLMKEIGNIDTEQDDNLSFLSLCGELFALGVIRSSGEYVICDLVKVIKNLIEDYNHPTSNTDPEIERYLANRVGFA